MHNRTIRGFALLLVLLSGLMLSENAQADASTWVILCGIRLDSTAPYLAENGTTALAERPAEDYAFFDQGVLTLNSFSMNCAETETSAAIYASGDLTVIFSGTNTVTYMSGDVQNPAALRVVNGTLTLCGQESTDSLTLTVISNADKTLTSSGIEAEGVVAQGQGSIIATGGGASLASYGTYSTHGMTVKDSAHITATASSVIGESESHSVGVMVEGALSVESAGAVLIAAGGGTTNSKAYEYPGSYGIYVRMQSEDHSGELVLSAGSVTATAGNASGESYGVYAYSEENGIVPIRITGGRLSATGGESQQTRSAGIALGSAKKTINSSLTITGGTVEAIGGDAKNTKTYGTYGFFGNNRHQLVISGGSVTFACGNKGYIQYATDMQPDLGNYPSPKITVSENRDGSFPIEKTPEEALTEYKYLHIGAEQTAVSITVQASLAAGGSTTLSGEQTVGSAVTATAEASEGYVFTGWYEGEALVSSDAAYTFTVSGSRSLTARFERTYHVSVVAEAGGLVSGTGDFAPNMEVVLTAIPASGYDFAGWYVDGGLLESKSEYTFIMPGNDITLTARWTPIEYSIICDLNGGVVSGSNPTTYTVESAAIILINPTRQGYVFAGWTGTGLTSETQTVTIPTGSIGACSYTATWLSATDTAYTVEHYVQNVEGTEYVKDVEKTKQFTGQTGAMTTAVALEYEGFTAQTVIQQTITADGSTVVAIYYNRNVYSITLDLGNEEELIVIEGKFGAPITAPATPTKRGYEFAGWSPELPTTMPASDITYIAQWTASNDTIYTVEHHFQSIDGKTYVKDETATQQFTGATGAQTTAAAMTYTGFTAQPVTQQTIAADGSTVVAIYYNRNVYSMTLDWGNEEELIVIEDKFGAPIIVPDTPTRPGYEFAGWSPELPATMPADNVTYTAQWMASSNTAYTVEHHFQNIDDDEYTENATARETRTGVTGEQTTVVALECEGFIAQSVPQQTIAADGSTVVAIYYNRNVYSLTLDLDNEEKLIVIEGKFGAPIIVPDTPTRPGYEFAGWSPELPLTMPADNVTYTAQWMARNDTIYTVKHHFQNIDDDEYTEDAAARETRTGTTGELTAVKALVHEGFTAQTVTQQAIAADGSTVVEIYYNRNVYSMTLDWGNEEELIVIEGKFGAPIIVPDTPTKPGYEFAGWSPELPATMPAENGMYTAQWMASSHTAYTVEHYFQNIDDDEYTENAAARETRTGTTGELTAVKALECEGFTAQTVTQQTIAADGSTVVVIYYNRNAYTLTINLNNGEEAIICQVMYGAPITAPAIPTKPGYEFAGWRPELPATMPAANVTYTAQWTSAVPTLHTIHFVANGGTGSMSPVVCLAGSINLPDSGFIAPAGKQFKGWALSADGPILTSTLAIYSDVVLYAIWDDLPAEQPLPVIIQPSADKFIEVYEGDSAVLTVIAQNADAYQWYVDTGDGRGYKLIPEATRASYTVTPVRMGDDGRRYVCVISSGTGSVTSPVFELLVMKIIVPPYTGDTFNLHLWVMLTLLSFAGIILVKRTTRKG